MSFMIIFRGSRLRQPVSARAGSMAQVGSLMLLDTASLYFRPWV
jgi:hypothetical protein